MPRPAFPLSLWRDRQGGIAMIAAIVIPILAVVGCGAIDLVSVSADRGSMQDVADATALAMAKQLGVATASGISARADQFAREQLKEVADRATFTVTTSIAPDNSSLTVVIDGQRQSFFGNLLPPGGWRMHTQATAATLGRLPLCVLSSGANNQDIIHLTGQSRMSATGCLVQSNSDIAVNNQAVMTAGLAQASGSATGMITPAAQTGAPNIADPFASMSIKPPLNLCTPLDLVYDVGVNVLAPGVHCGNITVRNGAIVTLLPGEHYFEHGSLQMQQNSTLTGSDVTLIFDDSSSFAFDDTSVITLSGRRSGPYSGFVIATTRANTSTFEISSTSARQLEGTVYVPNAILNINGSGNSVANQSAWTVVVAKSIQMTGSPNLVVNANYAGSSVPVPGGVGPNVAGKVILTH